MRKTLSKYIKETDYFGHADMWNTDIFPIKGIEINVGLGESNLLNIAGGISSQGNTIYIYGVAGFIIHRVEQLKFSCKHFGAYNGKIVICNAGKYGYEDFGIGHKLDDDHSIMRMLDIPMFQPLNIEEFQNTLETINFFKTGIFYIQLGRDET